MSLGTRCAGINAATLAIIDAGIPMSDFVVACAAGYVSETPILGTLIDSCSQTSSCYR